MFELKLSFGTTRTTVTADVHDTIAKALRDNEVSTQGALIFLNGTPVAYEDLDQTFDSFGVRMGESAMLSVTVKASSAR